MAPVLALGPSLWAGRPLAPPPPVEGLLGLLLLGFVAEVEFGSAERSIVPSGL